MSKPIPVVTDYRTRRGEMREAINGARPRSSPVLGVLIGFACALVIVSAVTSFIVGRFAG